ncbi:hypothetical protein AIC87_003947 [Salmonella enterica subsp. enterica serovar Javiana]|nr:hypothetical protein [Salmonella enterica]EGZ4032509.1 hypothetical protein [Salmonella enterica subsp. enterica serovar Javiana]
MVNQYMQPKVVIKNSVKASMGGKSVPGTALASVTESAALSMKVSNATQNNPPKGETIFPTLITTRSQGLGGVFELTWEKNDLIIPNLWLSFEDPNVKVKHKSGEIKNVDPFWCDENISAGVVQNDTPSFTDGSLSYTILMVPGMTVAMLPNAIPSYTWVETPALEMLLSTPVLDFGTVYTGSIAQKELNYSITSNVISGAVNVTYRLANVSGDGVVTVDGKLLPVSEQVTTNSDKNTPTNITRSVEIKSTDNKTGDYAGQLIIDLELV